MKSNHIVLFTFIKPTEEAAIIRVLICELESMNYKK